MLPAAPLVAAVEKAGGMRVLHPASTHGRGDGLARAYYRARRRGVLTVRAADQLAVRLLKVHPVEVWGDEFWRAKGRAA